MEVYYNNGWPKPYIKIGSYYPIHQRSLPRFLTRGTPPLDIFAALYDDPLLNGLRSPLVRFTGVNALATEFSQWTDVPAEDRHPVEQDLADGERPLAWLLLDLNHSLRYARGMVVLTSDRLIFTHLDQSNHRQEWPLDSIHRLELDDAGDAGILDLFGTEERLAHFRMTAAQFSAARKLIARFGEVRAGIDENPSEIPAEGVCATCGATLVEKSRICPECGFIDSTAPASTLSMLKLLRFARPWAGMILLGLALAICGTAAGLVPPYVTMPLLDRVLIPYQQGAEVDRGLLVWYLAALGGASILAWGLSWARTWVLARVSERISGELRNQTYSHLQRMSLAYFGGRRTGDLIARISTDTDRICFFLSVNLLDFASDVLLILLTAGILLSIDPLLAILTLLPLPFIAWLVHRVREKLRGGFAAGGRAWGEMNSVLADTIPGIRVVKAFAQEQREIERFRRSNQRVLDANDRINGTWSFFRPVVVLLTDMGLLVVWACGAWAVFENRITVGVLTAFVAYISRFYGRLDSMSRMLAAAQKAAASAHRIFEILDAAPGVPEAPRPVRVGRVAGAIEFRGVSFGYDHREVIRDINLSIQPGEMVGLVGPSGSGKSTLINLVCRFHDVTEGAILVDGVDVRELAIQDYRRNIGLVLQEPFLFFGTIAENIAYGRPEATSREIVAAARAARAHDFIMKLPDGYDSLVGERGQGLSGGERQRISIARALLIDPAILIMDEATSSVDTETEREIQLALENLIQGRTTIAIAHRLSTLYRADRLVVLEDGEIIEVGPHGTLMRQPGTYQRLHQAQLELAQQGQAM